MRLMALGALLYPLVVLGFVLRLGVPFLDALLLGFLIELLPVLAVAQVPLADRAGGLDRETAYKSSAAMILLLAVASVVASVAGPGLGRLGLGGVSWSVYGTWTALLLLASGALLGAFHLAGRVLGIDESALMIQLLPRTRTERRAFVALSVVAGVGEEIAFRGFAISALTPAVGGVWPAVILSCVAFGVLHAYQGGIGFLRAFSLGMLLAASVLWSGSLWPAVTVHTLLDWAGGLWFGPRLWRKEEEELLA